MEHGIHAGYCKFAYNLYWKPWHITRRRPKQEVLTFCTYNLIAGEGCKVMMKACKTFVAIVEALAAKERLRSFALG